jgi:hypothetical protein
MVSYATILFFVRLDGIVERYRFTHGRGFCINGAWLSITDTLMGGTPVRVTHMI